MATRMQQRRDTAANWSLVDPILAPGEIGFETDTGEFRVGNGTDVWSDLSPFKNIVDLGGSLDDYILLSQKGTANGVATLDSASQVPLNQLGNVDVSGAISTHNSDTTNVHGIVDTAALATKAYADNAASVAVASVIDSAPAVLNTLNEIAAALGNNANFSTTISDQINSKANKNSPTISGTTVFLGSVDFSSASVVGIDSLPSQSGNAGKYLSTNGTTASWQEAATQTPHQFAMMG